MASAGLYRCRGVRKWCDRRCEVTTTVPPPSYPEAGFYCLLHRYQDPRPQPDGSLKFESPAVEEHVRRRTSFVAPEATLLQKLVRAPGYSSDGKTIAGDRVVAWLAEKRGISVAAATAQAQRMVDLGFLSPVGGGIPVFHNDKKATYRVMLPAGL